MTRLKQLSIFDKRYPETPGYQPSETSYRAAKAIESETSALRFQCLAVLRTSPKTADEVATALNRNVLAVRPRIAELLKQGRISDTGERRRNESGLSAKVWKAND